MMRLRISNFSRNEFVDFLSGPLYVHSWGWPTKVSANKQNIRILPFGSGAGSAGYDPVVETISIASFGCAEEIRDAIAELEAALSNAAAYNDDPLVFESWWLEWLTDGEAGSGATYSSKRSLILGGTWEPTARVGSWPMLTSSNVLGQLIITRHPFWEDVERVEDGDLSISSLGGTHDFTNVPGRVPARIPKTSVITSDEADTIWIGIRPEYEGLTLFDPVWECEQEAVDGAGHGAPDGNGVIYNDTINTDDATASNAHVAQTEFADAVMEKRVSITVDYVIDPTTPSIVGAGDFLGRYLVLCRCKVAEDGAGACSAYLQMKHGYVNSPNMTICDAIVVDNLSYQFRELGTIQIPPAGLVPTSPPPTPLPSADALCGKFTIELWAQKVDADDMFYDCLVLIPSDYYLKIEDADVDSDSMTTVYKYPHERVVALHMNITGTDYIDANANAVSQQWYVPVGTSKLVVASQRATVQTAADDIGLSFSYYPRWLSYRDT